MTAQELHRVLTGIGVDATPGELADALWLAMLTRPAAPSRPPEAAGPGGAAVLKPAAASLPQAALDLTPARPATSVRGLDAQEGNLDLRLPEPSAAAASFAPVRAQAGRSLRDPLPLTRALRPLRQQRALGGGQRVDEEATADLAAERRLWLPVFASVGEPAFDLALVIDTSDSMALWDGLVREFRPLCEQLGSFRDIRTWYLITSRGGSPSRPALRGADPASAPRDPRELLDPSGRRLILVVTDGVHPWWAPAGPLRPILAQWSDTSPVAILQPFPQRLWERSTIRPALAEFRANGPGRFTSRIIRPPRRPAAASQSAPAAPVVAVPILELTPLVMERWARLVAGSIPAATLGAAMLNGEPDDYRAHPLSGPASSLSPAEPADQVRAFRASVSPSAYTLAGYLSVVAPLTLPVMRLVQESTLPEAGPAEMAEVFLGGLLRRLPGYHGDEVDRITYGFAAGVREVLQSTITSSEALTLLDQVGSYLVQGQRGGRPFSAILASPVGGDITTAAERHPPFARVARKVLQRIGGPFAEAARQIRSQPDAGGESAATGGPVAARDHPQRGNPAVAHDRQPAPVAYRPWSPGQVRVATFWPERRDQPVSVALAPAGDRLAHSIGSRLSVSSTGAGPRVEYRVPAACALSPRLTWSSDGSRLAFRDDNGQGRVVVLHGVLTPAGGPGRIPFLGPASAFAFVPGDDQVAVLAPTLPGRMTLRLVRAGGDRPDRDAIWERALPGNRASGSRLEGINLAVSPDGSRLACTAGTSSVWVFDTATGRQLSQFDGHSQAVTGLAWVDGERIISAAADATLQVWHPGIAAPDAVVESVAAAGMTFVRERRTALVWSARGDLRAWSLGQPPVQLWYRDPPSRSLAGHFTGLAVSAVADVVALVDPGSTELILVFDWDRAVGGPTPARTYANAKVLVLGESGVGKSGLAMVLAGQEFRPTESTHGRRIWRLPATDEPDSSTGVREVLIWDLAGQPGYRIVHQLHLEDAALAIIAFDAKSESAPLAGVQYWARAVRHAHPVSDGGPATFLVAARADRGGISVSDERIQKLMSDFALSEYFKTSAKEGTSIGLLRDRILAAIDWSAIPAVTSTPLFAAVKQFIVDQVESGAMLTPVDELRRQFQSAVPVGSRLLSEEERRRETADTASPEASGARLASVFEECVARLESAGLAKRLKFGDYVLLQPELLDAYAGAIVNAAREEPDGLGSIREAAIVDLDFVIPSTERELPPPQERLLVLATLEELLQHELVLREPTEEGVQLVFPSAYRRDLPASEVPKGNGVVFRFEGPAENVYATLIVRLTRSNRFTRVAGWQSAARFAAEAGECTVSLDYDGQGNAELVVGYDGMPDDLREQFERFVHDHLDRRAIPGTVTRERLHSCPRDGTTFTPEQVKQVISLGRPDILCPVCENRVPLRDDYRLASDADQATAAMNASADAGRDIAAASAVVRGKEEVAEFDVFLCHDSGDKPAVRRLARQLRERGLRPWLDEEQLRPGMLWQPVIEEVIASIPAAAVVVGPQGLGPWQDQELSAFLRQFIRRRCPVVPVLLPGAHRVNLPVFLDGLTWVDLTATEPDPIDLLQWGITGRQPGR